MILNIGKTARDPLFLTKKVPIQYRFKKNIGLYALRVLKDMLDSKCLFGHCSTKLEIFIAGGCGSGTMAKTEVESYDIKKDAWKHMPNMNHARHMNSLCLFRNRFLYVFGGLNEDS